MTEAEALTKFKDFVASLEYTDDHLALAAKLGEAKALWAEAALSLACVRQIGQDWRYNFAEPEKVTQKGRSLLAALGLGTKIVRRI